MNTKDGTTNLAKANSKCNDIRGTTAQGSTATSRDLMASYSAAAHCVLIALRCAAS